MIKYNIYAGLGGKHKNTKLGPSLQMTREFNSKDEALKFARELAVNRYQYHEGANDILSWNQCKNYVLTHFPDEDWTFDDITEFYQEEIDYIIIYYVEEYNEN